MLLLIEQFLSYATSSSSSSSSSSSYLSSFCLISCSYIAHVHQHHHHHNHHHNLIIIFLLFSSFLLFFFFFFFFFFLLLLTITCLRLSSPHLSSSPSHFCYAGCFFITILSDPCPFVLPVFIFIAWSLSLFRSSSSTTRWVESPIVSERGQLLQAIPQFHVE